jgi:predicted small lipoprotein YifL
MKLTRQILALILVAGLMTACGKKGTPEPPADQPNNFPKTYPRDQPN